jgi:hypothetical protein
MTAYSAFGRALTNAASFPVAPIPSQNIKATKLVMAIAIVTGLDI